MCVCDRYTYFGKQTSASVLQCFEFSMQLWYLEQLISELPLRIFQKLARLTRQASHVSQHIIDNRFLGDPYEIKLLNRIFYFTYFGKPYM